MKDPQKPFFLFIFGEKKTFTQKIFKKRVIEDSDTHLH